MRMIYDNNDKDLVLLTLATTSFSESNWVMQATGPKISSYFDKIIVIKNKMLLMWCWCWCWRWYLWWWWCWCWCWYAWCWCWWWWTCMHLELSGRPEIRVGWMKKPSLLKMKFVMKLWWRGWYYWHTCISQRVWGAWCLCGEALPHPWLFADIQSPGCKVQNLLIVLFSVSSSILKMKRKSHNNNNHNQNLLIALIAINSSILKMLRRR